MERGCPRCEWLGQADGACPRCRTPLVDLSATSMAPLDTAVPPWARPRIVRHPRVAALDHASQPERTWIEEGTGLPDASRGRVFPARRRVWIPIGLVLAVMASLLIGRAVPVKKLVAGRPPSAPPLQIRAQLAFLTTRLDASSSGGRLSFTDALARAAPVAAARGQTVAAFEWGPGGSVGLIDAGGVAHLWPAGRAFGHRLTEMAFAPDGTLVATCDRGWPPRVDVWRTDDPAAPIRPGEPGCDPRWSSDGTYIAVRIPAVDGRRGTFARDALEVIDPRTGRRFRVEGSWPIAWMPGGSALTVTSDAGDAVEVVDPEGGRRNVLVSSATIREIAGRPALAPITALAWSPDGRRLAIGFGGREDRLAGVMEIVPRTRRGAFATTGYPLTSLSWSARDDLLMGFEAPAAGPTRLVRADLQFVQVFALRQTSWSPDGRWILGRDDDGWMAVEVSGPERQVWLGARSLGWSDARWCCPAMSTVTTAPGSAPSQ